MDNAMRIRLYFPFSFIIAHLAEIFFDGPL
jgi:hypothetical protein